jgi:hypothetical protein
MNETFKQYLLPNETVHHACYTRSGILVLSSRRVVLLNEKNPIVTKIHRSIPLDCVLSIESKKGDRFEVSGRVLDQFGKDTGDVKSLEIRAPKGEPKSHFESTMSQYSSKIYELKDTIAAPLDLSYLDEMPESLTRNAILDLNTVLRDKPVHDDLVHEATKFLGDGPFLLEESIRDGSDKDDGVLFAVGRKGYYWIQGKKQGRFMSNVVVNTVEWDNFQYLAHKWHNERVTIYTTYSLVKGGVLTTQEYLWGPPITDDTRRYPWLLQERNGPWILADVMMKYSER